MKKNEKHKKIVPPTGQTALVFVKVLYVLYSPGLTGFSKLFPHAHS